jgi:hypothetical protein
MTLYQSILEDLCQIQPTKVTPISPPYETNMAFNEKFRLTKDAIERSKRLRNRVLQITNLFYLGQLLEQDAENSTIRSYYAQQLATHYQTVAVQIYYIFEVLGVEQIARTTRTTSTHVRNLSQTKYLELVSKALEIFNGVENLAVGDVTPE